MSSYHYPVGEQITEPAEAAQDPGKRDRERGLIAQEAAFGWRAALDFGCGRGSNFDVIFDQGVEAQRTLTGIEPDADRRAQAEKATTSAAVRVVHGDVSTVENWPTEQRFGFILLCQVVGHTPVAETTRILRALRARLAPNGKLMVLAPFATAAAVEIGAPAEGDYYHLVDFAKANSPAFRRPLTRAAFDSAAREPAEGLLPVRCFRIEDSVWRNGDAVPVTAPVPEAIASELLGLQRRAVIYSVHQTTPQGRAAIGDLAIVAQA